MCVLEPAIHISGPVPARRRSLLFRFSKFLHGCYALQPSLTRRPWWISEAEDGCLDVDIDRVPLLDASHSAPTAQRPPPQRSARATQPQGSARCSDARAPLIQLSTIGRGSAACGAEPAGGCQRGEKGAALGIESSASSFAAVTCTSSPCSTHLSSPACGAAGAQATQLALQDTCGNMQTAWSPQAHGGYETRATSSSDRHIDQTATNTAARQGCGAAGHDSGWRFCAPLLLRTSSAHEVRLHRPQSCAGAVAGAALLAADEVAWPEGSPRTPRTADTERAMRWTSVSGPAGRRGDRAHARRAQDLFR